MIFRILEDYFNKRGYYTVARETTDYLGGSIFIDWPLAKDEDFARRSVKIEPGKKDEDMILIKIQYDPAYKESYGHCHITTTVADPEFFDNTEKIVRNWLNP